ncbi:beta-propeller fold lactonase family protein [Sphingomonas sp.]|uniref:beta-propeller fold lactonase family protein n=1 Tax=Sphingomonas sp. TaxID=28214 RepID=UPI002ED9123E
MRVFLNLAVALAAAAATPALADPPAGTLLVGNKGEDTLSLIDLKTGAEIARLPTGDMPHEIAVSPDGKLAAVVAYGGSTIDVFDLARRTKLKTIDIAPNSRPHGLIWLADGRLVATAEKSKSVVVIAADGTMRAIVTDALGSHMVAIAPDARHAYVANIGSGSVGVLDLQTGTRLRDIAVGGKPEGLSLARGGKELWVGDLDAPRVQVYDTTSGAKLAEIAIDPVAIRVATSPDGKTIATSNVGAGTVSLIDVATRKVVRTISVSGSREAGQVTILFSSDGKRLYAAETGHNKIAEIDMASGKVLRRLDAGLNGDGLALAPALAR